VIELRQETPEKRPELTGIARTNETAIKDLAVMAATLRRWIIQQSFASNVGHIGSALSVVDIMATLWGVVMRQPGTSTPDRDRFVLSKGHAALALYSALRWKNLLDAETFHGYCGDGSPLGVHPEISLPGIDASTGSLGQGLSLGCGMAYGLRLRRSDARVYVLVSDAECNEGQIWEAVMFAAQHRLSNLTVVVDLNGLQAMGSTLGILNMDPVDEKWRAFGWECREVDGHDLSMLFAALGDSPGDRPRVVLAHTVLGKGVSFMEGRFEWHYQPLNESLYATALRELEAA
jgi:transketolase